MTDIYIEVESVQSVDIVLSAITGLQSDGVVENSDASYADTVAGGDTLVVPDINVSNSDDSYSETEIAAIDIEIPDITITKNDDTTVTYPAAKDLNIGVIDPCTPVAPSGWAAMVTAYGIGYNYPQQTGQTTVYRTGDDADIEATIFTTAIRAANNLKPHNGLSDFTTLTNNNAFGTTVRFTDELGTEIFANDLIIDHYTGLMWYRIKSALEIWNTSIDNALSSTQGGHSDWFLPNTSQLFTITDQSLAVSPLNYAPFNLVAANGKGFISSTADASVPTTDSMILIADTILPAYAWGFIGVPKATTYYSIICRKHY